MKKGNETICALLDKVMRQQREIDNYKEQISLMERQNSGMLNDYLVKKDKNDFLTKENAELHREVEKLEEENEELKNKVEVKQALIDTLKSDLEDKTAKGSMWYDLQVNKARAAMLEDKVRDLEKTLKSRVEYADELEEENKKLKERLEASEKGVPYAVYVAEKAYAEALDKMKDKVLKGTGLYDNELERKLAVKEEMLSAFKQLNQDLGKKIEDLEGKLADLTEENAYLRRLSPTYKLYKAGFFGDDKSRPQKVLTRMEGKRMNVKTFVLEDGRRYLVPARCCFNCEHCAVVLYDDGGPYTIGCDLSEDEKYADYAADMGLNCDAFEEEKE